MHLLLWHILGWLALSPSMTVASWLLSAVEEITVCMSQALDPHQITLASSLPGCVAPPPVSHHPLPGSKLGFPCLPGHSASCTEVSFLPNWTWLRGSSVKPTRTPTSPALVWLWSVVQTLPQPESASRSDRHDNSQRHKEKKQWLAAEWPFAGPAVSAPASCPLVFPLIQPSLSLFQSCGDPDETQAQRGCCCLRSHSWEEAEQSLRRWPASLPPTSDLGAPGGQSPNLLTSGRTNTSQAPRAPVYGLGNMGGGPTLWTPWSGFEKLASIQLPLF